MVFKEIVVNMSEDAKIFSLVAVLMAIVLIVGLVIKALMSYYETQLVLEAIKQGCDINRTTPLLIFK